MEAAFSTFRDALCRILETHVQELEIGLRLLAAKRISPALISPTDLKRMLNEVNSVLPHEWYLTFWQGQTKEL